MPQFTLADLESRVLKRVDDALLYTSAEADQEINDGIRVANLFTGFMQTVVPVPGFSVADQHVYAVPAGILIPEDVDFEGRVLQKSSLRDLSLKHRDWSRETSLLRPVQNWAPIGLNYFVIHPADRTGGGNIQVRGIAEPPELTTGTDVITCDDETADLVVELAAHVLQVKEGGKPFADSTRIYQDFLKKMKVKTRWTKLKMPKFFVKLRERETREEVAV